MLIDHSQTSFLNESSEWSNTGTWTNHNDRDIPICWEPEIRVVADKDGAGPSHHHPVLYEGGTYSSAWSVKQVVPNHCHTHSNRVLGVCACEESSSVRVKDEGREGRD